MEKKNQKDDMFRYYQLIGSLKETIMKSSTMEEALKGGLYQITEMCGADTAIVWYEDKDGDGDLHPYYWIGEYDFTSAGCRRDGNMISRVWESGQSSLDIQYHKGNDTAIDELFGESKVSSVACLPFENKVQNLGCILIAKTDGTSFSDEQTDVCEIFSMLLAMEISQNEKFLPQKKFGQIMLSARDITKTYRSGDLETQVLKGVNLNIYEGEFLVVLGESGCGKSTFLNIIGGMDQADSGTFEFMGKDYSHATQEQLTAYRRDNIGFIFQSYNLMPNLTAKQNLDLIGELVKDPLPSDEALRLVGLEQRGNNYPSMLSGGQQQRVSIARALVKRPKLIFADEPTAALDYTTSIEVLTVMEEIVKQGATLVMVTHNEEITRMADRVVRMRRGKTYEITVNRNPVHAGELVW